MNLAVPSDARVGLHVTVPLTHLCPFRNETDEGTAEIRWTTAGSTLELHTLTAYLAGFAKDRISHEDLTDSVQAALDYLPGITNVQVITRWETAGAQVVVNGCSTWRTPHPSGCVTP